MTQEEIIAELKEQLRVALNEKRRISGKLINTEVNDYQIRSQFTNLLRSHREQSIICCEETCLCWDIEFILDKWHGFLGLKPESNVKPGSVVR